MTATVKFCYRKFTMTVFPPEKLFISLVDNRNVTYIIQCETVFQKTISRNIFTKNIYQQQSVVFVFLWNVSLSWRIQDCHFPPILLLSYDKWESFSVWGESQIEMSALHLTETKVKEIQALRKHRLISSQLAISEAKKKKKADSFSFLQKQPSWHPQLASY